MNRPSLWLTVLMLILTGLLMAACQPAAEEPAATEEVEEPAATEEVEEPTATEEPEATEEATAEPTEAAADLVELVVWADETRAPLLEELNAQAEELGLTLSVQQMGFGDIRDQLAVAGPAGEGPDIIIGAHDWLGQLVTNGLVAELDYDTSAFFGPAVDAFTYGGTLYGMPYATENIAFVCNMDVLGDRPVPATWDEVMTLAEELEAENPETTAWSIQTRDPYHWYPQITAFGGYIFGSTDTGYDATDVGLDSEGAIAAATWLEEMAAAGHVTPDVDYDVLHTMFEAGQVACIGTGPWAIERIQTAGVNYSVNPFPAGDAGPGQPFLGVQGFMVSAFSENQLLAQTFLQEVVASEEFMTALAEAGQRPSAFSAVRDAAADPDVTAFAVAGETAQPMPAIPEMSSVWEAATNAEELIITQQQSAEEAMTAAAEQIRTLIEGE